jgi:hypothetical protein
MSPTIIQKGFNSLKDNGVLFTLKVSLQWLSEKLDNLIMIRFDNKHGTNTAGYIGFQKLNQIDLVNRDNGHGYQGASKWIVKRSVNSLPINHDDYVFIDFGSGKGWVLLLASNFPFKKIIGIEISAMLHQVAEKNVLAYKGEKRKCNNIESLCMNVLDFDLPKEPLVCFLFNPFPKEVIRSLLDKIEKSLLESPRPVWIIYENPAFRSVLDKCQFSKLRARMKFPLIKQWNYVIYSSQ